MTTPRDSSAGHAGVGDADFESRRALARTLVEIDDLAGAGREYQAALVAAKRAGDTEAARAIASEARHVVPGLRLDDTAPAKRTAGKPPPVPRRGVRVSDEPVEVRELPPMASAAAHALAEPEFAHDDATPLPVPIAYHEAEPTTSVGRVPAEVAAAAPTGLSAAARAISARLGASVAAKDDTALARAFAGAGADDPDLDSATAPRARAGGDDEHSTMRVMRQPSSAEPHALDDGPVTRPSVQNLVRPDDVVVADRRSGVFDVPLGIAAHDLGPDGAATGDAALPPALWATLEQLGQVIEVAAGSIVCREGDRGESLYLLLRGEVSVKKRDPEDQRLELARLGSGSVFGEIAVMTDRKRHATVEARTACRLVEVPRHELAKLARAEPALAEALQGLVRERVAATTLMVAPLFRAIPDEARAEALGRFTAQRLPAGAILHDVGEPLTGLAVVVLGNLELAAEAPGGGRSRLITLGEGDVIGEELIAQRSRAAVRVAAVGAVELVTLSAAEAKSLWQRHPAVSLYLAAELARRDQLRASLGPSVGGRGKR